MGHWESFDRKTIDGEPVLLLTMMQDHCLRLEKMTDQEVGMEAIYALRKVYGSSIPWPTALMRSDWIRGRRPEASAVTSRPNLVCRRIRGTEPEKHPRSIRVRTEDGEEHDQVHPQETVSHVRREEAREEMLKISSQLL